MNRASSFLVVLGLMLACGEGALPQSENGVNRWMAVAHGPMVLEGDDALTCFEEQGNEVLFCPVGEEDIPALLPEAAKANEGKALSTKRVAKAAKPAVNTMKNEVASDLAPKTSLLSNGRQFAIEAESKPKAGSESDSIDAGPLKVPSGSPPEAGKALDETKISHDHPRLEGPIKCKAPAAVKLGGGAVLTVRFGGRLDRCRK